MTLFLSNFAQRSRYVFGEAIRKVRPIVVKWWTKNVLKLYR